MHIKQLVFPTVVVKNVKPAIKPNLFDFLKWNVLSHLG